MMEAVYQTDIRIVELLQYRLQDYSGLLSQVSNLCDPRYAYLLYIPLVFSLDWRIGKKLMWITVMVEWTNHLLKWLMHGERPYWWIHEAEVYNKTKVAMPSIQQFPLSCETGPGNPSGHSQTTAAIWYVIIEAFLQVYKSKFENSSSLIPVLCWSVYLAILTAVSVSRIFIAAHFPHQCLLGLCLGWFLAWKLRNIHKKEFTTLQYCAITAFMFTSAVSMYAFLNILGSDPMWTVERAIKWCAKPEHVHLDTTPFFSMVRYCGYFLGIGFGFNSPSFQMFTKQKISIKLKIALIFISVGMCLLFDAITLPKEDMLLFYIIAFAMYGMLSYASVGILPMLIVMSIYKQKKVL